MTIHPWSLQLHNLRSPTQAIQAPHRRSRLLLHCQIPEAGLLRNEVKQLKLCREAMVEQTHGLFTSAIAPRRKITETFTELNSLSAAISNFSWALVFRSVKTLWWDKSSPANFASRRLLPALIPQFNRRSDSAVSNFSHSGPRLTRRTSIWTQHLYYYISIYFSS